jgi:carbon catabolite-derepressing protein kinase
MGQPSDDVEELSISLSPSQIRRNIRPPPGEEGHSNPNPTPTPTPKTHPPPNPHQSQQQQHHRRSPQPQTSTDAAIMSSSSSGADPGSNLGQTARASYNKTRTEQRIGAYNIIKTLGEGSFGKVKLAVHRSTGQQVALKIISRKNLISRDMQGRVEREIEYLQLLRHPHIIKL